MTESRVCPGCGRHCDLNEPHCKTGEEYLRTGKLPERGHVDKSHRGGRMGRHQSADMNDRLVMSLRDVSHLMHKQYEGKASQKRILIILHESGTLTQRELTERMGIRPGSASEILSKLESAGLIVRSANETDRRNVDVRLTDEGARQALDAVGQRQRRHQEMFSCLSEEEQQTLLSLLEKVHKDWEGRFGGCHDHHGAHHGHGGRHAGPHHHHDW